MEERADHPHQAAVHLVKALRCCRECYEPAESDLLEIKQLQYQKDLLADQLRILNARPESLSQLTREVSELQGMIIQLRSENDEAQRLGLSEVDRMSSDRKRFEMEQREGILEQLKVQKNLTYELSVQLQQLMERVKYLNRVNNQLIYNFCSQ